MTVVIVVGWTVLGVALLIATLLASVLRVGAQLRGRRLVAWSGLGVVEARIAFPERVLTIRLAGIRVVRRTLGRSVATTSKEAAPDRREPTRSAADARPPDRVRSVLARFTLYRHVLQRLVRRVLVDACEGHLRIATPDPALTGLAYGLVEGLRAALPPSLRGRVTAEPDFLGELPGGRATLAIRVRVAVLALAAWRVFWFERGRLRREARVAAAPGRSGHATHGTARGARGAGA